MAKPQSPCKDCTDRYVGCHAACEKYDAFEEALLAWHHKVSENRKKYKPVFNERKWNQAKQTHVWHLNSRHK